MIDEVAAAERRTTRRRKPAEADGEHDLQDETEPERRQRYSGHRQGRRGAIEPAAAANRRHDARRHGQRERRDNRHAHQFERCRQPLDNAGRDRAAIAEAVAPVAARKRGEPRPGPLPEGTIEAERAAEALDVLGPDVRVREVDGERTAGRRVYQKEDESGDDEQQRDGLKKATREEPEHAASLDEELI